MKVKITPILLMIAVVNLNAQTWSGMTPGDIYYNSGKVGIGTASPRSPLHISGDQGIDWQNSSDTKGTGLLTIGDLGGNGSLFINTPTHNPYYSAGLGIDGSYNTNSKLSIINVKAFGVKYDFWSSSLAFHTSNGTVLNEAMRIDKNGNVGIGTNNPLEKLHIEGNLYLHNNQIQFLSASGGVNRIQSFGGDTFGTWLFKARFDHIVLDAGENIGNERKIIFKTAGLDRMMVDSYGNVLIGKTTQENVAYKLDVNGAIRANEIVVNTTGADFVFNDDYELKELEEIEEFIKENKHLPGIPSAQEMSQNGVALGEMDSKLLQKIEELTLYVIELKKSMEVMEAENQKLKERMVKLESN